MRSGSPKPIRSFLCNRHHSAGGRTPLHKAGEAYIEALNRKHQLFNKGSIAAKVLVVFVGEEGKPTIITSI